MFFLSISMSNFSKHQTEKTIKIFLKLYCLSDRGKILTAMVNTTADRTDQDFSCMESSNVFLQRAKISLCFIYNLK